MNNDLISRERAIKELLDVYEYEYPTASGAFDEFVCQIMPNVLRYIPAVDAGPKWTSTAERLPVEEAIQYIRQHDELPEYLVWIKGGAAPTTLYFTGDAWVDDECTHYSVTHWMPLPELPKEG